MKLASAVFLTFLFVLAPAVAEAASIVRATYSIDGNVLADATYTGEDGGATSDPDPYWNLLGNPPERVSQVTIKPDQQGGTTATLKGNIVISITIRNTFSMGTATTESLTLMRDNADTDKWYLSAEELKRIKTIPRGK